MFVALAGRKVRPGSRRIPQTQTSGAAWHKNLAPPRGFIRQDSLSLQPGSYPTASLEPCRHCASVFGSVVFQSHRKPIERSGPASRPAITCIPKPIPSADPSLCCNSLTDVRPDLQSAGWMILLSLGIFDETTRRVLCHSAGRSRLEAFQHDEDSQCGFSGADKKRDAGR
jgi:hypothetical protein